MTLTITAQTLSIKSIEKLNKLSGESVKKCMQCATCTGMCPMVQEMDFSPRKVMHLAQFGLVEKLADINTYWKCASCHACSVKCPRGIDIAKVMEALSTLEIHFLFFMNQFREGTYTPQSTGTKKSPGLFPVYRG